MSDYIIEAVYSLYPSAIRTVGIDENIKCYNSTGDIVPVSFPDIQQEAQDREEQDIAQAEAKAQLRTSVINKIATNLSSEEKLWLEENL
jgi:hypothetical protein